MSTPADTGIVGLQTAGVDLTTTLGRSWACTALATAVLLAVQHDSSSHSALYAKLMCEEDHSSGVRACLLYQAVKDGLVNVAMWRHGAWRGC